MELVYLKKYTPAEILLLRDGYSVKLTDIFKYTLIDLIYKKVIRYDLLQHFEVASKFFISLSKGENYHDYIPQSHEETLMLVLANKERLFINDFIKKYLVKFDNEKQIKNQIINNSLTTAFDRSFLDGIFNRYTRNDEAIKWNGAIFAEIQQLEAYVANKDISSEMILEILSAINGNILFLDKESNPIIKEIEKEIQRQLNKDSNADFDIIDVDFSFSFLDMAFNHLSFSDIDFDGGGGGDFGGGGADGDWDFLDIDFS